jgi:branched-chain amino acid transport system ATP-binding protein
MLQLNDVVIRYGRTAAVQGLTLEVNEGEIVGLIGPNGAGKSTTLLAITGVLRPSQGEILFEGRSLVGQSPEKVVRHGVALVPEGRHIFADLTVGENLLIGTTIQRDRGAAREQIDRICERFPILAKYFKASAGKLSGGEQQQLAIARALLCEPKLLLLDEPSLGLAPFIVDQVFEIVQELRRDGVTVLLVEQNAARTVEVADRSYVLHSGRGELLADADESLTTAALSAAYFGERPE